MPYGQTCVLINKQISINITNLANLTKPFNSLAMLYSTEKFQVLTAKVKNTYFIDFDITPKTLEKSLKISGEPSEANIISLDDYTLFDYEKNEVNFNSDGVLGFNIPKYSHGYYELELIVCQNNSFNKLLIKNNFNFSKSSIEPYVSIRNKRIESLENFKEVIFND